MELQGSDDLVQGPRHRWVPIDPRQVEIHRLMEVFGPAPAAFYADACRLLAQDPPLTSTTHVVGHLLRELESTLREILRPMIPAARTADSSKPAAGSVVDHLLQKAESTLREILRAMIPAARTAGSSKPDTGSGNHKRTHKQEIDAIATALGFPPDDEVHSLWKSFQLERVTHRGSQLGPRPVDDDFRALWDNIQILLLRLGRQFESSFTASLPLIDELAGKERPDGGDMKKLRGVPHSVVALERFFERAGPGWFPLLRGKGYLSDPPPLEVADDETIAYARWPAGRYLARMAAEPTARSGVIEVALALETDNPQAHERVAEAAVALPAADAARLAPKIASFLASRYQWALPLKARDLIGRLAQAAEADAALLLLLPLIEAEAGRGGWRSAGFVPEIISAVFPQLGLDGLELLADMLDQALDERRPGARTWRDHSYLWRPTVEAGREHGREDVLTSTLSDAVVLLAGSDDPGVAAVVEALERRERAIFHRLALHVLRHVPNEQLIAARIGRRELFDDSYVQREYTLLLREHAATLPNEIQARILGWIDAGPQDTGLEPETVDRWRLLRLARFGDALPEEQVARYRELVERFGEPAEDEPEIGMWVGPTAPLTTEELLALHDDDLVAFLRSWQPGMEWSAPSREGLRQTLEEAAAQAPDRFAALAPTFADLDPVYAQGVISGLRRAADQKRGFEWQPVFELGRAVIDKPRALPGRDEQEDNEPNRGWVDVRLEVAHLLDTGLRRDLISAESDGDVFEILAELAKDPQPSASYEQRWRAQGNSGPVTLDLNTVRGAAFHAIMRYAWWRTKQTASGQTARLGPQLRELLDRHLDPEHEPTETVRSVYGHFFPALIACDEEWARSRVDAIFPRDPSLEQLRRVAWDSYLLFNRPYRSAYELLSERYREAVAGLTADSAEQSADPAYDETKESLVRHVFGLYAQGTLGLGPGSLVDLFFQRAPVDMRADLIENAGRIVANTEQPSEEALERLQRLWEWRRRTLQEREGSDLDELKGFGWWVGSGKFDDEWALAQLHDLLANEGTVEPDDVVTTRLAALRHERLAQVVACLSLLIDAAQRHAAQRPWFVTASRDDIRAILEDGITAEDPETHRLARETVNRLIARGHVQFGDLLS